MVTSTIEILNKEEIVNDIDETPKVDMDKLAALKARAAQKRAEEEQEVSVPPRIVEEQQRSLRFGIVGSGQAGCIDGKTNIFVSQDGILPIRDFFNKHLSCSNVQDIIANPGDICVKIPLDKNIFTISINPETGEVCKRKVMAVWKLKKQSKNKIITDSGTEIICSKVHPSLVLNPSVRKRAYFKSLQSSTSITNKDRFVGIRSSVIDQLSSETVVGGIIITEEIAWLLGLFAGDGSTTSSGNEISFYLSDPGTVVKASAILNNLFASSISISDHTGCKKLSAFGFQIRYFFESAFGIFNGKTYSGFGSKTFTIDIPSCISAASSNVRAAFISGLLDSDGTICKDWCESSISTVSELLADKLCCLIASIGGRAHVEKVMPRSDRENESTCYRVRISGKINHGPLLYKIVESLAHYDKKEKLNYWLKAEQKSFNSSSVPLFFEELSYWLKDEGGMTTINNLSERSGVCLKSWSRGERKLSIPSFEKMINSLEPSEQSEYIKSIYPKLDVVKEVFQDIESDDTFYDLTVEEHENYLAGNFGFIFTHNSRLAESMFSMGYPAVCMNTAPQDLENIKIPEQQKLLLDFGLGGAAKDLSIGHDAADAYRAAINQLIQRYLGDVEMFIFCTSLGGGSGAGSVPVVVDILAQIGKPIAVLTVLPKASEDAQLKHNAWQTLSKFTKLFTEGKIHNIITVDNAKIESLYSDVGPFNFFNVSNKAIVEPLNVFNTLSRRPDEGVKVLDSSEFGKLFMDGRGFTTYGVTNVPDYEDEMAIATAIVESLKGNLLASGFNIRQARYAGFMLVAPERIWNKIPSSSLHFAQQMILDACDSAVIFHGIYKEESDDDCIKVYSMFSGLGLPEERINQLKTEAQLKMGVAQKKDEARNMTIKVDVGEETTNQVDEIKRKIQQKASSFTKLHNAAVQDRRKK